jgi:hypothetical protein
MGLMLYTFGSSAASKVILGEGNAQEILKAGIEDLPH